MNTVHFWRARAIQLTVVSVRIVVTSPIRRSAVLIRVSLSTDDPAARYARHAIYPFLASGSDPTNGCVRAQIVVLIRVSLSSDDSAARYTHSRPTLRQARLPLLGRLRSMTLSPSSTVPRLSPLSGLHGFLKRHYVSLGYPLSLSLRLAKRLSLLFRSGG